MLTVLILLLLLLVSLLLRLLRRPTAAMAQIPADAAVIGGRI